MMKIDTSVHRIELKHARDDIKRHKPVSIKMWNRPDDTAYVSIEWKFIHVDITMFTRSRPTAEVEQMLRDAKVWSMIGSASASSSSSNDLGEEYTTDEEE